MAYYSMPKLSSYRANFKYYESRSRIYNEGDQQYAEPAHAWAGRCTPLVETFPRPRFLSHLSKSGCTYVAAGRFSGFRIYMTMLPR
jgi:hypothetical protein